MHTCLQVYGGLSVVEFTSRWKIWQGNVNTHVENRTFRKHDKLQLIMKVLSFYTDTIKNGIFLK